MTVFGEDKAARRDRLKDILSTLGDVVWARVSELLYVVAVQKTCRSMRS